jgi:hypothetical protein
MYPLPDRHVDIEGDVELENTTDHTDVHEDW